MKMKLDGGKQDGDTYWKKVDAKLNSLRTEWRTPAHLQMFVDVLLLLERHVANHFSVLLRSYMKTTRGRMVSLMERLDSR